MSRQRVVTWCHPFEANRDQVTPYTALQIQELLQKFRWAVWSHPAPPMFPCDLFPFSAFGKHLSGTRFTSYSDVQTAAENWLFGQGTDYYQDRNLKSGERSVPIDPLVNPNDILFPPLHIKLEFMKNFVKSINKEREAFQYFRSKFPRLSDSKTRVEIFMGPQICKIMKYLAFDRILEGKEKAAWEILKVWYEDFYWQPRRLELSTIELYCMNNGKRTRSMNNEHGERFHQDMTAMERRYQWKRRSSETVEKRTRRPKILRERSRRTLKRVVKQNRKSSLVEISQELQSSSRISVSSRTVQRELKNLGFHGRAAAHKPNITPQNAKHRLQWCRAHRHWTVNMWKTLLCVCGVMNLALQFGSRMDASGFGGCPANVSLVTTLCRLLSLVVEA
ncbi:uncharacterized protein TNCV_4534981 [Trichonephila clavipes]|nr:uncharacterized protein TNCV_4534981 [Trichonephila clavipes]